MKDNNNVYERAKALVNEKQGSTSTQGSVYERAKALIPKSEEVSQYLDDLGTRIGANAEAYSDIVANKGYEKAKTDTKKMLEESTLNADPYPTSEDVQKEELQGFMDDKANEARARGMKNYLDSTIGAWSADRVNSVVDDWTDSRAQNMRRNAERVSRAKAEGVIPEGGVVKLEVPAIDMQLPKSVTEANIVADRQWADRMAKESTLKKVSFADLSGKSQKEASKIVKDYLAENPHMEANAELLESYVANNIYNDTFKWKLENDEQFFADAYEAMTGKSYAEYKREVDNEARANLESMKRELEAMNEALKKKRDENRTNAGQSRSLFSAAWSDLKNPFGGNIEEIENLIDEIDNVLEGSFSSGFDKGFDFDRMATVGLSGVFTEGEMAKALHKAKNGESLTEEGANYVRIHQYAQELNDLKSVREKYAEQMYDKFLGFNVNAIGEGVGTTVEMMPAFAGGMTATGMIGSFAKLGGKAALKAALKEGGKELFKYGVKTTGKLGYNFGLAKVRGLAAAPFMPSTYNTYLDSLNSAYKFDDEGNLTYTPVNKKQAYFGAVFSTANEISSEYLGAGIGEVVGWGARGLGRMVAGTKLAEAAVGVGKKARKHLPKFTPQAKAAMRTLGVQADPVSETLSEALGDIMTSYEQTWIGMDVDKSQYGTMDYWMTLAGVTLVYGGSMAALGAVNSYRDVKKAVKAREDILGQITDRSLHDALVAISTSDDVVMASAALADMNWEAFGEEAHLARAYVAADLNVKILEGAVEEESRLDRFRGTIEGVRNIVYQGKAGEYSDIIREAEMDGKKVYIINGYEANTNQYIVVDAATGEKTSVDKSKVTPTREIDVDTYIQEAYQNTFSLEAEKQRVADVKAKALQLDNPTEKDVARVASTLGIALPKVGNTVMLANGNMGAVTEVLSPTEYAVQDPSGATYKVHFTDIISTDKLTATAQGALVRGEVAAPIAPAEEVAQPTEAAETTPEVTETTTPDDNGITIGAEVPVDGRVGKVRARTQDGKYAVAFEDESGNYEDTEVEFFTGEELASLMGIAPMPTAEAPEVAETAPTEMATTEDGRVDIEQMSAEDAAKALIQRTGTIEEAIAQVKQVIETVAEERKKAAKAEKKTSLNDIGKKSAELQALDTRLEFYSEVLGVLEGMLAEQQEQTMTEAQNIAEEAGVAPETTEATDTTTEESKPVEQPTSGLIRNGAEMKFTDNVIKMVDFVAKRLGITVEFVDGLKNEAGQSINGDITGKRVRISTSGTKGIKFIMGHEFFHRMKDLVDEQTYAYFLNSIREYAGEKMWNATMAHQRNVYRNHNARVAKEAMAEMTIEDVAKIAAHLNINIEGLSLEDAKTAVARGAAMGKEQGIAEVDAIFPTMLSYDDALMVEECAADVAGALVTNTNAFAKYVEDNSPKSAIMRGLRKAIRAMSDFFDSFGYTEQQRKLKALDKMLAGVLNEAAKNEAKAEKKAIEGAARNSLPSLVGVHNISLDKLRKVIKMGGLANPSVAVIDVDKQTHDDYGEYSLVLPKNMVDARQGKNAGTWAGDAWTPTYPQVIKRMKDDKAYSRFHKDIEALPEAMRNRVRLDFDSFMDGRSAYPLAYWYLFEKGTAPELVLVPSRYSDEVANAISEATKGSFSMYGLTPEERAKCLEVYIAVKFNGDKTAFENDLQERIARLTETIETKKSDRVKKWAQSNIDAIKEYGFDYDSVADFIRDVQYDVREKGTVNVDATIMAAREQIKANNFETDYEAWLNGLEERYGIEEYIFDGYTNSGNRRYLPHTVENASKWMKKQGREGAVATFPSFGVFIANAIPKMTTLESIRKRKALLGKSNEEFEAFADKWLKVYHELGNKLQPDAKGFDDYGYWRLIEAVGKNNPKEFIKKEYGIELSEEDMAKFNDMVNAIRTEYPARYFETKFERPLQLNDFTAAVVPNDIPLDVESRLKDAGVEVIEYEKDNNASRAEAMQKASQMENVRFSIIGEVGATALDMAEEATIRMDNLAIARQMEERGDSALDIRMATGWERGADSLWRYEVMDAEVNLYDGNETAIRKKIEVAEEEEKDFMQQSKADTKELRERTNTYLAEMREKYGVAEGEETDAMTEEEIAHLQSLTGKEIAFEDYKERRRNELYNRRMALEAQLAYVITKNTDAPAMILTSRLGYVLKGEYAERLFKAYPSLKDMEFRFVTDIQQRAFAAYAIDGGKAYIELNVKKTPVNMVAPYLMHEVQHAIQHIEGFAEGGSPAFLNKKLADRLNVVTEQLEKLRAEGKTEEADALVKLNKGLAEAVINNDTDDYGNYQKLMGEIEARNVSARLNMSAEERMNTLLSETEDVAREDQIFLRDGVEMAMAEKKKSADETVSPKKSDHSTAISSADGAKILKKLDNLAKKYQEKPNRPHTFIGDVAEALGINMPNKSSKYGTYETISGDVVTIRLSNHNATASNLDAMGEDEAISIVVTNKPNNRLVNDGESHIIEFYYNSIALGKADGKPLVDIINSLKQTLYSGKYVDKTGLAEVQEINPRYSLITPEMDADYLSAVERGDMATAQQMVMEAAKLAMPNTKVVDENGNPKVVYHGTPNIFTVFDKEKQGSSTDRGIWGSGFYFSESSDYAQTYAKRKGIEGQVLSLYLNLENPLFISLKNGGNDGAYYFKQLHRMHFTDEVYSDIEKFEQRYVKAQEDLSSDLIIDGYDGVIVEYSQEGMASDYVAFNPNQIKSADPVTYDDNGNVIPLSERFNPEKEDIRYSISSEEDARFERKVAFLRDLVREYNIPLPTFIAQTKEEFKRMAVEYGIPEEKIDENIDRGYYCGEDDIVLVNAELHRDRGKMHGTMLHEHGHHINKLHLSNKINELADRLNPEDIEVARKEIYGDGYADKDVSEIINELICFMVGHLQIEKTKPTFEGQIPTQEFIEAWKKDIESNARENATKSILYEVLPLVKENLEYQKEQYGAEKENTIVIARKEYVQADGGGYKEAELQSNHKSRPFKAQSRNATLDRRGEGADAQEVTRYHLPDPDPNDVFYDEIPIFDEQGNEVDITTLSSEEAKAILDSKVRQMLEAEYDHAVVAIRKEAEEARRAVKEVYRAEKEKRRKGAKAARTNAARIDEIFGDTPFESLPYEVQALILIATGEAKIYWGDRGNKRGLASELGLTGSTGDRHAYRNIWGGAKKSFNEVVHDWWESLGGQERGIDDQDLRNALISALQSVQSSRDAMQEIINKYDDLAEDRDNTLAEIDRNEEKELHEAKSAYEQHLANFELSEGEERTAYHDRAAQFFGNQSLSRVDDILEDLTNELERSKRKIERLKAEKKDVYTPLAESIQKAKDTVLRALERLRMFAGMEEVDLNDVARLINLVKASRSQRQVEELGVQATALVQRVSIKKAKTNLMRLLSLKLSNTDIIHKMLKESDTWTKEEREAILKHLWKVSRNGLRVSKAVHKDTKEIVDELKSLVDAFRKNELKGLNDAQKAKIIEAKLAEVEKELHPEVVYDSEGNVQDNANLPTDFNAENKYLAKFFFKSYLEMLAKEMEYHNAAAELREKIDNKDKTDGANTAMVVARENYLNALNQFNSSLESLILEGKDKLRDWNAQKEKHEIEIRSIGIRAIGGKKASGQGKASSKMARARARINTTVNAPYWTFETVLEKIDHSSPYKKGKLYTYFMDKWADANDDLINRYAAHMEEIAEVMRKCFPDDAKNILKMKRNPYALYQYIMRKAESTPIGTLTYKEMGENGQMRDAQIVLNVANAMYVIAMWRQPRYQEAMQEKHAITQSDIDALMANIASVNAGFLDFMDWVNETFLPSTRLEYDVVYRKMNGGSMPKEINYFPARVAGHKEVDLANIDNGALPTTPSALKDRTSAHIMPQLGMDYFKVLESHIQDMDNWAAYAELTADLNVLLSSDEFRRRCNDYMGGLGGDGGGKGSLYDLFKQTSLIATGMYRGDAGMEALLGQLQKAWATSNIAFRGWTAVKQISSITTGMFDNWAFYKHAGIAATGIGIYHEIKNAMKISPSLRYRWKSGAAGMEALARETQREDGYTVKRGAYEKGKDFIGDAIKTLVRAGMTPNAAVDLLACSIIVNSVYETEIARLTGGKREATEEEKRAAVRKAERAFNTTQQSSEGAYLAPVQANPAYGVLTTYMNASFALHRKRMGGIKELWKLATSKKYRRYLKDEFGVDAAKISAKDAFKDILSGVAGELSFAMMGWGLMKVMTVINGWLNDDDDDEDVAAAKQEFFDSWWQSLLNGYLGGSVVSSWINGFDTSLTPAYDEFAKDVYKLTDDKGSVLWELGMMFTKYGIGIDLESLYKSAAAIENMYEDDERAGAVLMFLNAPDRYVKAFVGDRREGETLDEYTTRVGRTYALLEEIKFDEKGKPVGGGVYENFVPKSRYNDLDKVFEEEYREDMLKKYGGDKGYADYTMVDLIHKQICELLDWNPNATPSEEKVQTDMQDELEYYQKRVAKAVRKRKNWVGDDEGYYDLLMDEQEAKNDLINNYYEYIKQTGLGAY